MSMSMSMCNSASLLPISTHMLHQFHPRFQMAKTFSLRTLCYFLLFFSIFPSFLFLYWPSSSSIASHFCTHANLPDPTIVDLLTYPSAWSHLDFSSHFQLSPPKLLKIAVFVKKWPVKNHAGGLERHASTLHIFLAKRGHEVHIFTSSADGDSTRKLSDEMHFHLSKPTAAGYLDQAVIWEQFRVENSSRRPFDVIHTESVSLMHTRSRHLRNLVVSWHGIAYESIHSDILQESLRNPDEESQAPVLTQRVLKVVEEIKFFPRYAHHVATSNHVGDILKTIYMLPEERVHVILNGVDENVFKPEASEDNHGRSSSLILGLAGRLVKDKGHPLIFEALQQIFNENSAFRNSVVVLVAGDCPWGQRYKDLGSNVHVLGPLDQVELARFYNKIDVFVNPTLRAQGLDHTLLEAMMVGKPVVATRLASITGSVITSQDVGYTFSPTVEALKKVLYRVWEDGRAMLKKKGQLARRQALEVFTATKMAAAYEQLFLCIYARYGNGAVDYCTYKRTRSKDND